MNGHEPRCYRPYAANHRSVASLPWFAAKHSTRLVQPSSETWHRWSSTCCSAQACFVTDNRRAGHKAFRWETEDYPVLALASSHVQTEKIFADGLLGLTALKKDGHCISLRKNYQSTSVAPETCQHDYWSIVLWALIYNNMQVQEWTWCNRN